MQTDRMKLLQTLKEYAYNLKYCRQQFDETQDKLWLYNIQEILDNIILVIAKFGDKNAL